MTIPSRRPHVVALSLLALMSSAPAARAQSQPAMIPTVLANALYLDAFSMFGRPTYDVGHLPANWPAALVPANARVIGSGAVGNAAMLDMRVVVFDMPPGTDAQAVISKLALAAGYKPQPGATQQPGEGFVTSPAASGTAFCKGASMVTMSAIDSVSARGSFGIYLISGEPALQNCARTATPTPIQPPRGARALPNTGSSWNSSGGNVTSALITSMPADSVLMHYTKQLVAAGWKSEGRAGVGDGTAVQRFSFRERDEEWSAALIVLQAGERLNIDLQFARKNVE